MSLRVVAFIQARVASSRLPGKVLEDILDQPMLVRVVERAQAAESLSEVVVATTTEGADDEVQALCEERGYACFRGEPYDVLDRIYQAAQFHHAEVIVRLTGDCPLLDPELVDEAVQVFLKADPPLDFVANRLPGDRTYPVGLDTEVCSMAALERAWREAEQPHQREHVMPYLYEEPGRFRTLLLHCEQDYSHLRWTVDSAEDLMLVRELYARLGQSGDFGWREVLELYRREPQLAEINAAVTHKTERDVDSRKGR